jgi:hypothetical protein
MRTDLVIVIIFNLYLFACITLSFKMTGSTLSQRAPIMRQHKRSSFIRAAYLMHNIEFLMVWSKNFVARGLPVVCQTRWSHAVMIQDPARKRDVSLLYTLLETISFPYQTHNACKICVLISQCTYLTYLICRTTEESYARTIWYIHFISFTLNIGRHE